VKASGNKFRAGVGLVVTNARGAVLAIERSDRPGAWQLPQGGIERDEAASAAAYRELREETGLGRRDVELLAEHPLWLGYELPRAHRSKKTGRGQVQRWFLFRLRAADEKIRLPKRGEARAWRWFSFSNLVEGAVDFRRGVYAELRTKFSPLIAGD
jgi:putative (di)nucleoside polyphosphate hydrolase